MSLTRLYFLYSPISLASFRSADMSEVVPEDRLYILFPIRKRKTQSVGVWCRCW